MQDGYPTDVLLKDKTWKTVVFDKPPSDSDIDEVATHFNNALTSTPAPAPQPRHLGGHIPGHSAPGGSFKPFDPTGSGLEIRPEKKRASSPTDVLADVASFVPGVGTGMRGAILAASALPIQQKGKAGQDPTAAHGIVIHHDPGAGETRAHHAYRRKASAIIYQHELAARKMDPDMDQNRPEDSPERGLTILTDAQIAAHLKQIQSPAERGRIAKLLKYEKSDAQAAHVGDLITRFGGVAGRVGAIAGGMPRQVQDVAGQVGEVAGGMNPFTQGLGVKTLTRDPVNTINEQFYTAGKFLRPYGENGHSIPLKDRIEGAVATVGLAAAVDGFVSAFKGGIIKGPELNEGVVRLIAQGVKADDLAASLGRGGRAIVQKAERKAKSPTKVMSEVASGTEATIRNPDAVAKVGDSHERMQKAYVEKHWRERTQAQVDELTDTIGTQGGKGQAGSRLRQIRADLKRSLAKGAPHPVIESDLAAEHSRMIPPTPEERIVPTAAETPKPVEAPVTEKTVTPPASEPPKAPEVPGTGAVRPETPNAHAWDVEKKRFVFDSSPDAAPEDLNTPRREDVAALRHTFGWDEYTANHRSWDEAAAEANKKGYIGNAETIAQKVLEKPRALSDSETAGLGIKLKDHIAKMEAAKVAGDAEAYDLHNSAAHTIADALDRSGTEKGRGLAAQKLVLKNSYDRFSMERKVAKVRPEGNLTPAEKVKTERVVAKVEKTEAELRQATARAAKKQAESAFAGVKVDRTPKRLLVSEDTYRKALETMRSAPLGAGISPEHFVAGVQIIGYHLETGVRSLAELVTKLKTDITHLSDEDAYQLAHDGLTEYRRKANAGRGFGEDVLTEGKNAIQSEDVAKLRSELDELAKESKLSKRAADEGLITKLRNQVNDISRMRGKPMDLAKYEALRKSIGEVSQKLNAGRGEGPTVLRQGAAGIEDAEVARLRRQLAEDQHAADQHIANLRKPSVYDRIIRLQHFGIFSGPSILGKLMSATVQSTALDTLGDLFVKPLEQTGLGKMAGDGMSGLNVNAEVKATTQFLKGDTWLDAWKKARTGVNSLDIDHLDLARPPKAQGWFDFFGHLHGALKTPLQRSAYIKAVTKRTAAAAKAGIDVAQPEAIAQIGAAAYNDSLEAIFQNPNKLSSALSNMITTAEHSDNSVANFLGFLGHILAPVTKTPTNIVGRTIETTFGLPAAAAQGSYKGIAALFGREFTEADAQGILKLAKRGGPGAALFAIGYMQPDALGLKAGGYYAPGTKTKKGDDPKVPAGHIQFNGHDLPAWLVHGPLWEPIQLGATFRRAIEGSKNSSEAPGNAMFQAGYGLMEHTPFLENLTSIMGVRSPADAGKVLGRTVEGVVVPGAVQQIAKGTDDIPRKIEGFGDELKAGVPGLRQTLPAKADPLGRPTTDATRNDKVIKEMARVGASTLYKADPKGFGDFARPYVEAVINSKQYKAAKSRLERQEMITNGVFEIDEDGKKQRVEGLGGIRKAHADYIYHGDEPSDKGATDYRPAGPGHAAHQAAIDANAAAEAKKKAEQEKSGIS